MHSLNSLIQRMSKRINNEYIRCLYRDNNLAANTDWKMALFEQLRFFAKHKARKIYSNKKDVEQEAYLGLWYAIDSFNYRKDFDFFRWAEWNISSKIRDFLRLEKAEALAKVELRGLLEQGVYFNLSKNLIAEAEIRIDFYRWLNNSNKHTSKRDRKIIVDIFFVNKTLTDVAAEHLISTERVRQLRNKGIRDFRYFMNKQIERQGI